jgi:lantibiotic modifying enzyme
VLGRAARWLQTVPPFAGPPLPGLYVGEAGIGAALLRAGQVLGDPGLIDAAEARGRFVAFLPHASPDLFNGSAGRVRFHLFLWDATGNVEHLRDATEAGDRLLDVAEVPAAGERCWRIPAGYDGASDRVFLGYAHGAAGIADVLLDLHDATGQERFAAAARDAGRWLVRQAEPALDDGSGVDWPDVEGGSRTGSAWCHGATGIGRFFLHAAASDLLPTAGELARRAARTAAYGARWAGPTQCHGLAGAIEFLLDCYQAGGDRTYLADADQLARILQAFLVRRDLPPSWHNDVNGTEAPDLMVGYAGVLACLLRLSDPDRLPHILSRAAFRRGPEAMPAVA